MTKRTHSTGGGRLLVKVALVAAAMTVPTTAVAVPAMAAPSTPGVVRTDYPQDRDNQRCDRDDNWRYGNNDQRDRDDHRCDRDQGNDWNYGWNNMFPNGMFGSS
ncbi:hypothetical protein [Nocardia australiensis]|uniref:hypothetical protein n=1 Tax=Nocardia australiensis TaxID=2887191 RepID=UPI001D14A83D|nr:hypothetical protein [Nocardia australiensis]